MKIVNIDEENLYIFRATCGNSVKFSQKMGFMIMLKATKNQGFSHSLENTFGKTTRGVRLTTQPFQG